MDKMMKRFMAAAAAGVMVFCMAGCGDKKNESSGGNTSTITEDEMSYGATITKLLDTTSDKVKISVEYDNRFLTEEEAILVSDYIAALNNADAELMEQTVYMPYLEDMLSYNGVSDTKTYLQSMRDNIEATYAEGGKLNFDYVVIEGCVDETEDDSLTGFSTMDSALQMLSGEDIVSKITLRKRVSLELLFTIDGEGSYSLKERQGSSSALYIYEIDGELYIL